MLRISELENMSFQKTTITINSALLQWLYYARNKHWPKCVLGRNSLFQTLEVTAFWSMATRFWNEEVSFFSGTNLPHTLLSPACSSSQSCTLQAGTQNQPWCKQPLTPRLAYSFPWTCVCFSAQSSAFHGAALLRSHLI